MNLFTTDNDEKTAATHLDDIRLNKMITESCQMLVITLVKNGLPTRLIPLTKAGKPYKTKGHANHPVTVWTGKTRGNFRWHLNYLMEMMDEYTYRTGKTRAGIDICCLAHDWDRLIPEGSLERFQNSSLFPNHNDVIDAYRFTMNAKWKNDKIKVKWTKRKPPEWLATAIRVVEVDGVYYRFTEADQNSLDQNLLGSQPQL